MQKEILYRRKTHAEGGTMHEDVLLTYLALFRDERTYLKIMVLRCNVDICS